MAKLEIGASASGTTVRIAKGDQVQLTLPETRTAGYSWQAVTEVSPVLAVGDDGFARASAVGGTGTHRWTLSGSQAGSAKVEMVYGRSWEPASAAKQRFTVTIDVK